jgi:hypothetical protein
LKPTPKWAKFCPLPGVDFFQLEQNALKFVWGGDMVSGASVTLVVNNTMAPRHTVVLAENHPEMREQLSRLLQNDLDFEQSLNMNPLSPY